MRDLIPIAGTAAVAQLCRFCNCRNREDRRLKSTRRTETEPTKTNRFLEESIWGPFKGYGGVDSGLVKADPS